MDIDATPDLLLLQKLHIVQYQYSCLSNHNPNANPSTASIPHIAFRILRFGIPHITYTPMMMPLSIEHA